MFHFINKQMKKTFLFLLGGALFSACAINDTPLQESQAQEESQPNRTLCRTIYACKRSIEKLVQNKWRQSQYYKSGVTVKAHVLLDYRNGIMEFDLLQPSGDAEADKAIEAIFRDLAPFMELRGLSVEEYGTVRDMTFILSSG